MRSGGTEERGGIAVRGAVSRRQQQLPKHEQEHYRPHQEQQQQQGQQQQQQDQDQDQEQQSPQQQQQQPPQEDEKEAEADVEAEAELPRHLLGQKPDFKAEGGGQSAGVCRFLAVYGWVFASGVGRRPSIVTAR